MQLPDDFKTTPAFLGRALYISAAVDPKRPFEPIGVSVAVDVDGTRYVAVLRSRDDVIRMVETVLNKAEEAWPEMGDEEQGDSTR